MELTGVFFHVLFILNKYQIAIVAMVEKVTKMELSLKDLRYFLCQNYAHIEHSFLIGYDYFFFFIT